MRSRPHPIPLEPVQITTHDAGGQDGLDVR